MCTAEFHRDHAGTALTALNLRLTCWFGADVHDYPWDPCDIMFMIFNHEQCRREGQGVKMQSDVPLTVMHEVAVTPPFDVMLS